MVVRVNQYEQAELNELEDQAQFLREWDDDRREGDYVPYPLANVLKPNPLLRWAFYAAVGLAVALIITLLLL